MSVAKELSCPHCKKSLPFGQGGFQHDAELNFICSHCGKVVFAVTEAAETELKKVASVLPHSGMGFHGMNTRREPLPIRLEVVIEETSEAPPTSDSSDAVDCEEFQCFI